LTAAAVGSLDFVDGRARRDRVVSLVRYMDAETFALGVAAQAGVYGMALFTIAAKKEAAFARNMWRRIAADLGLGRVARAELHSFAKKFLAETSDHD
jgi:hypothetical protein